MTDPPPTDDQVQPRTGSLRHGEQPYSLDGLEGIRQFLGRSDFGESDYKTIAHGLLATIDAREATWTAAHQSVIRQGTNLARKAGEGLAKAQLSLELVRRALDYLIFTIMNEAPIDNIMKAVEEGERALAATAPDKQDE